MHNKRCRFSGVPNPADSGRLYSSGLTCTKARYDKDDFVRVIPGKVCCDEIKFFWRHAISPSENDKHATTFMILGIPVCYNFSPFTAFSFSPFYFSRVPDSKLGSSQVSLLACLLACLGSFTHDLLTATSSTFILIAKLRPCGLPHQI